MEGWKCITNDPLVSSIVAKGYRLRFTSPGNARADFPNASGERNLRNISRHSRVLFERIHGTQGIWRVASSYRLKTTEPPHRRSSLSHAHHKLSAEYRRKKRLCVQNRSAGCVLSCTNTSTQQEVPSFCLRKQGISVSSTSLQSELCPSGGTLPNILPENLVAQRSVPIYGITQLGLRSHPTGSSTLEALTTLSFIRSDKPVFNTPAFRPCSPCYPTQAVAEPIVSHIRNPYLTFTIFTDASTQGWGAHMGDSQIAGVWTRSERELHIIVLELRAVILALNHWAIV